nr:unnamed protein product [Digitaria exilis]
MRSRWQHGSSGELDVFGATSYFASAAGGLPDRCPAGEPRVATRMEDTVFCELHHAQLGVSTKPSSSGKTSKLAALLSFMVSPSPRASFRKTESLPPPSPAAAASDKQLAAAGDEPATTKASSSSSSSRELQGGCGGVHEVDLGVAMGDRRLQGVRVVRGGGGDQQRWVVRCSAWDEEERHESSDYPKDDEVEGGDDGDHGNDWESDSSSDLFDLDLECLYVD